MALTVQCVARRTKIILQRQLPELRMQCLHVDLGLGAAFRGFAEYAGRTFHELVSPLYDLVRVQVEILRKLDQCSGAYAAPLGPRSPSLSPLIAATATFALNAGL